MMGDPKIGKSSLLYRLKTDEFIPHVLATATCEVNYINDEDLVKLQIWDQPRGSSLIDTNDQFYKGASAAIICFHLNQKSTYENVQKYVDEINEQCGANVTKYLVGLQSDTVTDDDFFDMDEMILQKETNGFHYCERTSAKKRRNVDKLFKHLS